MCMWTSTEENKSKEQGSYSSLLLLGSETETEKLELLPSHERNNVGGHEDLFVEEEGIRHEA